MIYLIKFNSIGCFIVTKWDDADLTQGVPPYPLYKTVASALLQWIISGSMSSTSENVASLCEDEFLKEIKDHWNSLVSAKGSELVDVICLVPMLV